MTRVAFGVLKRYTTQGSTFKAIRGLAWELVSNHYSPDTTREICSSSFCRPVKESRLGAFTELPSCNTHPAVRPQPIKYSSCRFSSYLLTDISKAVAALESNSRSQRLYGTARSARYGAVSSLARLAKAQVLTV